MKNAQNIVAIKETLSRQSFHAERKKSVATTIRLSHLKQEGAQDLQVVTNNGIPQDIPIENFEGSCPSSSQIEPEHPMVKCSV